MITPPPPKGKKSLIGCTHIIVFASILFQLANRKCGGVEELRSKVVGIYVRENLRFQ